MGINIGKIDLKTINQAKEDYALKFSEEKQNLKKLLIYDWDKSMK